MRKCVIVCAGDMDIAPVQMEDADLVIAADGGVRHTQRLGITPYVVLGDFDSLGYVPQGAIVHPVEKDDTDAMLAVRLGLERGYNLFYLYGAMDGTRVDHTLANFQLLQFLRKRGAKGYLVGNRQTATVLWGENAFAAHATGVLSLFAMDGAAAQVSLTGLKYELQNGSITPDFPLGVSNRFVGAKGRIAVGQGSLLAIYDTQTPFWEE